MVRLDAGDGVSGRCLERLMVSWLNFEYLKAGLTLFVDTDGALMVFGVKPKPELSERLRGREQAMKQFLIAQARKG